MSELKLGQHCKYFHYLPEAPGREAGFVEENATFLGLNPNDPTKATIAFLNPTKLHLLQGSDWSDAFTRKSDVPREADGLESHHSWDYVEAPTDAPVSDETAQLKEFLFANFKSETGDETPIQCAIRLLAKLQPKKSSKADAGSDAKK